MMSLSLLQSMIVTNQSQQTDGDKTQKQQPTHDDFGIRSMPHLLAELIDVVAKIAKADQMMAEVHAQTPQDPGAEKWHEVSKQALAFSREALHAQQQDILERLKSNASSRVSLPSVNCKSFPLESKEHSTPTTPSTSCESPMTPISTPSTDLGMECQSSDGGEEPKLSPVVQDLKDQYGVRSMRKEIETLKKYPEKRVLIIRKIKALGFESTEILKEHFGQYGAVSEVIVPHSFTKPGPQRKLGRIRPGVMGFVVMQTAEGAEAAIAHGESQLIHNPHGDTVTAQVVWFKDSYSTEESQA